MSNKFYVVTGAAERGIGEAVTRRLISDGFPVIGTYENTTSENAKSLVAELGNLEMFEVDHSSRKSLQNFVTQIEGRELGGLVNVQMFFSMENLEAFDHDSWDKSLAVNLSAPNFLIHSLKGSMPEGSSIVIVTSTEGFNGSFGASAYAATKAAIHNLTKTHSNNLGKNGVRINCVAPGWIGGVMDTDEVFNLSRGITPLGRLGDPKEVASTVKFLLSDQSSFISGSVVVVDGGYTGVDSISKYEFDAAQK